MSVHRKNLSTASWDGCKTVQRKDLKMGRWVLDQWVQMGDGEHSWKKTSNINRPMEVQSLVAAVGTGFSEVCLIRFQSRSAKETCQGQMTKGPSHRDNWRGMHSLVTGVLSKVLPCSHLGLRKIAMEEAAGCPGDLILRQGDSLGAF